MKAILTSLLLFFLYAAQGQMVVNDPNAEVRAVGPFHGIKASGGIEILLTKSDKVGLVVSNTVNNDNSYIKTEVKDGILNIYPDRRPLVMRGRGRLKVYVAYTDLQSIKGSGACDFRFADKLETERFDIELTGACNLKGIVSTQKLSVELSGASDIRISGSTSELQLKCSGASDFKSPNFSAQSCIVELSGASDASLNVTESLKVNATGASNFNYSGSPSKTEITKSGSSDVNKRS